MLFVFGGLAAGLAADAAPAGKIKVLYAFNGGHDGKAFIALLGKVLERAGEFTVTAAQGGDDLKAENVGKYDLVLFYGSGGTISDPEQEQGLSDFVDQEAASWPSTPPTPTRGRTCTRSCSADDSSGTAAARTASTSTTRTTPSRPAWAASASSSSLRPLYHKNSCMRYLVRIDRGGERQSMASVQQPGRPRLHHRFGGNQLAGESRSSSAWWCGPCTGRRPRPRPARPAGRRRVKIFPTEPRMNTDEHGSNTEEDQGRSNSRICLLACPC